jgi:hypothetical protein
MKKFVFGCCGLFCGAIVAPFTVLACTCYTARSPSGWTNATEVLFFAQPNDEEACEEEDHNQLDPYGNPTMVPRYATEQTFSAYGIGEIQTLRSTVGGEDIRCTIYVNEWGEEESVGTGMALIDRLSPVIQDPNISLRAPDGNLVVLDSVSGPVTFAADDAFELLVFAADRPGDGISGSSGLGNSTISIDGILPPTKFSALGVASVGGEVSIPAASLGSPFEKTGVYDIRIEIRDLAGNVASGSPLTGTVQIVPANFDPLSSSFSIAGYQRADAADMQPSATCSGLGLLADGRDTCVFKVELRDRFGNLIGSDGTTCGDGLLEGDEECDRGISNYDEGSLCTTYCTYPRCGDGIVQQPNYDGFWEQCDSQDTAEAFCTPECTLEVGSNRFFNSRGEMTFLSPPGGGEPFIEMG